MVSWSTMEIRTNSLLVVCNGKIYCMEVVDAWGKCEGHAGAWHLCFAWNMFSYGGWDLENYWENSFISFYRSYCPSTPLQTPHSSFLASVLGLLVIQTRRVSAKCSSQQRRSVLGSQSTVYDGVLDFFWICAIYITCDELSLLGHVKELDRV